MTRPALDPQRIVAAAIEVADRDGLAAVSMRNVAKQLGVEAMSLYHHVAGKEALLDALVDRFFAEIELPPSGAPWRQAMAVRAHSARATLTRHPWALGLIESRTTPLPNLLRHHDAVLGNLRTNGFSVDMAAHAFSVIDAYVFGFVLTELNLPFEDGGADGFVGNLGDALASSSYPHLVELIDAKVVGRSYAYADEFEYGLQLILGALNPA